MARDKTYKNNQRGDRHPSDHRNNNEGGGGGGRHGNSSSRRSSSDICIPFLANKCTFEKGCRKRHPSKEELPRLLARYKQIRCRFGDDCYTDGCLFLHPKETKKNIETTTLIEPHHFPPLGGGSVGSEGGAVEGSSSSSTSTTAVAVTNDSSGGEGADANVITNANSPWNNVNINSMTSTSIDAISQEHHQKPQQVMNNHPVSSSNSSTGGRPLPIQDHPYQQEQPPPPVAWEYANGVGSGLPPPPQQHMNPQGPLPPPAHQQQQAPYYRRYGGPPPPPNEGEYSAAAMIDPNTGYPMNFDPATYYHQMQQLQYYQYPLTYPPMCPPGAAGTMGSPLQAQAKEFIPGNIAHGYA